MASRTRHVVYASRVRIVLCCSVAVARSPTVALHLHVSLATWSAASRATRRRLPAPHRPRGSRRARRRPRRSAPFSASSPSQVRLQRSLCPKQALRERRPSRPSPTSPSPARRLLPPFQAAMARRRRVPLGPRKENGLVASVTAASPDSDRVSEVAGVAFTGSGRKVRSPTDGASADEADQESQLRRVGR